jgi:hypothetical protein
LEKTMEADISIWRKTGHFYFALTARNVLRRRIHVLIVVAYLVLWRFHSRLRKLAPKMGGEVLAAGVCETRRTMLWTEAPEGSRN